MATQEVVMPCETQRACVENNEVRRWMAKGVPLHKIEEFLDRRDAQSQGNDTDRNSRHKSSSKS